MHLQLWALFNTGISLVHPILPKAYATHFSGWESLAKPKTSMKGMHLPCQPQFEGVRSPPALNGLVTQIKFCIQLVWLEQVCCPAGIRLFQDVSMPRQKDAALQGHPLQAMIQI